MDFVKDSIPRLLLKLAVPASTGFFFNTMFNVVDTYWGGQLSTETLAALSLSFPVFFIIVATGAGKLYADDLQKILQLIGWHH